MVQLCVFTPRSKCVHVPDWNNKSRQSWGLVVGGGRWADTSQIYLETESRWSSGQCCCQESFLSLLIKAIFFFSLVDVLIMTVLTGEAPVNWEDWVPLRYGWVCAAIAAPTLKYEATPKNIDVHLVCGHFRFFQALKCTYDVDSVVFLCDTNRVFRLPDFFS